jgi:type II secretory pathway component GspD/PulD (secretin)
MRTVFWLTAVTLVASALTTAAVADYVHRHPSSLLGRCVTRLVGKCGPCTPAATPDATPNGAEAANASSAGERPPVPVVGLTPDPMAPALQDLQCITALGLASNGQQEPVATEPVELTVPVLPDPAVVQAVVLEDEFTFRPMPPAPDDEVVPAATLAATTPQGECRHCPQQVQGESCWEHQARVYQALADELNRVFPDCQVCLGLVGDKLVVSGQACDGDTAAQILRIVNANAPAEGVVVDLLQVAAEVMKPCEEAADLVYEVLPVAPRPLPCQQEQTVPISSNCDECPGRQLCDLMNRALSGWLCFCNTWADCYELVDADAEEALIAILASPHVKGACHACPTDECDAACPQVCDQACPSACTKADRECLPAPCASAEPAKMVRVMYPVADLVAVPSPRPSCCQPQEEVLKKLITETIVPSSWNCLGGHGHIDYYPLGVALVITHTPEVQEQVRLLLDRLREMVAGANNAPGSSPRTSIQCTPLPGRNDVFRVECVEVRPCEVVEATRDRGACTQAAYTIVTPPARQAEPVKPVVKIYPVADLVEPLDASYGQEDCVARLIRIVQMVEPESWQQHAQVEYFPPSGSLVVRQTPEVQEQVESLLQQLRDSMTAEEDILYEDFLDADSYCKPGPCGEAGVHLEIGAGLFEFKLKLPWTPPEEEGAPPKLPPACHERETADVHDRISHIYRLRNTNAHDVANAIAAFLHDEMPAMCWNEPTPVTEIERDVVVTPEPISNSLIISATPRYYEEVEALIRQLDEEPPQVVITTLIAEVRLDDGEEFGTGLGAQSPVLFQRSVAPASVPANAPDFPCNQPCTVLNGFAFGASADAVNALLRNLKAQGKLEVLSRPQITALDNQVACIHIGQQVPYIANSTVGERGQIVHNVQQQTVGISLQVTPKISPDDHVSMRVEPQVSSLSPGTVNLGNNVFAPIFNIAQASTTVTAMNGQTVAIGGLVTRRDHELLCKVPLLSELPIIGAAFRCRTQTKQRTELVILLTPQIVRGRADAERIKAEEASKLNQLLGGVSRPASPCCEQKPVTVEDVFRYVGGIERTTWEGEIIPAPSCEPATPERLPVCEEPERPYPEHPQPHPDPCGNPRAGGCFYYGQCLPVLPQSPEWSAAEGTELLVPIPNAVEEKGEEPELIPAPMEVPHSCPRFLYPSPEFPDVDTTEFRPNDVPEYEALVFPFAA